jgi:putative endonuclease
MKYFVYIIKCADDSFYVGITTDLSRRINQHNGIIKGGAKYTRTKRPVTLCFFREYLTRSEASQQEYMFKKLTHEQKKHLCDNDLPID